MLNAEHFDQFENIKVANICGSCGKKAIPLVLLGADVTVFDISEDNKRYAMEVADNPPMTVDMSFVYRDRVYYAFAKFRESHY